MNLWLLNIGMECLRGELYSEFCLGIRNDVMIPYGFAGTNAKDMYYEVLADHVHYFKEDEKGWR